MQQNISRRDFGKRLLEKTGDAILRDREDRSVDRIGYFDRH